MAQTHTVSERLRRHAPVMREMGSPLYAALVAAAADDYDARGVVRAFFDERPARAERSRIAVRLMGAAHYCALAGIAPRLAMHLPSCGGDGDAAKAWDAMRALFVDEPERMSRLFERTPQTNEVARSTLLLAGLLAISASTRLPVRLFDLGTSAGLNLRLDHYRYEGAT